MTSLDRKLSNAGLSLYATLEIEKTANNHEIKKTYHKLALTCHPDKHSDLEKLEQFQKINRASQVLRDPKLRFIYDQLGSQGLEIVDKAGIEVAEVISRYDTLGFRFLFSLCFCLTGGCCGCFCGCCLCLCCCGKLKPGSMPEDDPHLSDSIASLPPQSATQNLTSWVQHGAKIVTQSSRKSKYVVKTQPQ